MRHSVPDPILSPIRRGPAEDSLDTVDLRETLRRIWSGRILIATVTTTFLTFAILLLSQIEAEYSATAKMIFGGARTNVVNLEQVIADPNFGQDALRNQVEVLQSTALIERVIVSEDLAEDPRFNTALAGDSNIPLIQQIKRVIREPLVRLGALPPAPTATVVDPRRRQLALIHKLRRNLELAPIPGSHVLELTYRAEDPALAAQIANAVGSAYIADQVESKRMTARSANDWLTSRVEELRGRVQAAEREVEEIRGALSAEAGQSLEVSRLQLSSLASALTEEQTHQARLASQEARLVSALTDVQDLATVPEFRAAPGLLETATRLQALDQRLTNSTIPTNHVLHTRLENEMATLRAELVAAANQVVETTRQERAATLARSRDLAQDLALLEARVTAQSQAEIVLREAEREAEASRILYENFLTRLKETSVQEELQSPGARILSPAEIPMYPDSKRQSVILTLTAIGGLVMGAILVLLRDAWNNRLRTPQEVEEFTGLPVLSALPSFGKRARRSTIVDQVIQDPRSSFAESIRNLRTSIQFSAGGPPPKVVLFTSSVPSEGKTTTAALLGKASQKMGRPTIVIDCDLRVPALSTLVRRVSERPGLVSVIEGKCDWRTAIHTDPATGLHVLTARRGEVPREANAADILSGAGFRKLLSELSELYEMIILDTPPTLAVTDARILAGYANAVIYAVRWNKTSRGAVEQGLRELASVQAPVSGIVLTMMDPAKAEQYAYDGYRYDKTRYGAYFAQ